MADDIADARSTRDRSTRHRRERSPSRASSFGCSRTPTSRASRSGIGPSRGASSRASPPRPSSRRPSSGPSGAARSASSIPRGRSRSCRSRRSPHGSPSSPIPGGRGIPSVAISAVTVAPDAPPARDPAVDDGGRAPPRRRAGSAGRGAHGQRVDDLRPVRIRGGRHERKPHDRRSRGRTGRALGRTGAWTSSRASAFASSPPSCTSGCAWHPG